MMSDADSEPSVLAEYEARIVQGGMPTDCCEYSVVSLSRGIEICRVWQEEDARKIANTLNAALCTDTQGTDGLAWKRWNGASSGTPEDWTGGPCYFSDGSEGLPKGHQWDPFNDDMVVFYPAILTTLRSNGVVKALEDLEMCRDLMQEAKGHEGPNGGFITNHLDDAENWLDKVRAHIEALSALRTDRKAVLEEERAQMQVIEERDRAEDMVGKMYSAVTGKAPEWSNLFGYEDALLEVESVLAEST